MGEMRECSMCGGPGEVKRCGGLPSVFTWEAACLACGMRSRPSIQQDPAKAAEELHAWWNRIHGLVEAGRIREALSTPAKGL